MTAKEKILDGIKAEAEIRAAEIIKEAENNAKAQRLESDEKAKAQAEEIIADAEKKAKAIAANAESSAMLLKRNTALKVRSEAINEILKKSAERLNSYSDEEYFAFLTALTEKNRLPQKGVMYLGKRDASRNRAEFIQKLSEFDITLSETFGDINGGFILQYDEILINCGFEALINEKRERLIDVIAEKL